MGAIIRIQREVAEELGKRALQETKLECCGLLAGSGGVVTYVFPAENVASEPAKSYEIAPKEIFRMMREFRAAGLEFLGIYHSHPDGKNEPSTRDIELAYYSEETYFIPVSYTHLDVYKRQVLTIGAGSVGRVTEELAMLLDARVTTTRHAD